MSKNYDTDLSRLQKIQHHPFITMGIIVLFIAVLAFALAVHWLGWDWTGFNRYIGPQLRPDQQYRPEKTLWDWLQLLIIPLVLAIGGFWLNRIQKRREEQTAAQRAELERELARNNQEETLLQAYIDKISELLLKEHFGERVADGKLIPEYEQVRKHKQVQNVARVRTITILTQLNARRIGYVFTFLREAGLMSTTANDNMVSLENADFHAINWSKADLSRANLSQADLSRANLRVANLSDADLSRANLSQADLSDADLSNTNLSDATLSYATLSHAALGGATLSDATLSYATLSYATLSDADLSHAILFFANLSHAALDSANLSHAALGGATLSDANLSRANLQGANLSPANLSRANLSQADLSRANLRVANLSDADLSRANLQGANLSGANLDKTILKGARYNTKELVWKDKQGKILDKIPPTQWPQGFDPKAAGAIEKNSFP